MLDLLYTSLVVILAFFAQIYIPYCVLVHAGSYMYCCNSAFKNRASEVRKSKRRDTSWPFSFCNSTQRIVGVRFLLVCIYHNMSRNKIRGMAGCSHAKRCHGQIPPLITCLFGVFWSVCVFVCLFVCVHMYVFMGAARKIFRVGQGHNWISRRGRRSKQGSRQNFFQGGSKVISVVQGGSKSKNFAVWVGQIQNFSRLYGQNKKICRAKGVE